MKTKILGVLTAVLMSAPVMATESLLTCYTPEATAEKVRNELSGETEIYGLQVTPSHTHRGDFTGWVRGRKAKDSDDQDSNISSNLMMAKAKIVNGGLCKVIFYFDRSKEYCQAAEGRPSGCFYKEMKITFSGDFLNEDGSRDADFYYQNPEEGQSWVSRKLGLKSEIPQQARALKCHADIDVVRDLCQKARIHHASRSMPKIHSKRANQ